MNDVSEMFWNASVEELKQGYIFDHEAQEFVCLVCGSRFLKGVIYSDNNIFFEAEKYTEVHIANEHSSVFDYLIGLDRKITGLTDLQTRLLKYFYIGMSDNEIVREMNGGSSSTIRNHRFSIREKVKQAKVFLAIMELVEKRSCRPGFINIHRTANFVDHRYAVTEKESEEILKAYFKQGLSGPLSDFPKKEKRRLVILRNLIEKFDADKQYTEKEINVILKEVYHDYVILRRSLIDYGFMDRLIDGSRYWVKRS